jgi:hypothetical protein
MKAILAAGLISVSAAPAYADGVQVFLECRGYNPSLNAPIEHEVWMSGNKAEVDGKPFAISIRAIEFVLTGPIPTNDTLFYINRLTGEHAITPASLRGDVRRLEWSREGEGCKPVSRRF